VSTSSKNASETNQVQSQIATQQQNVEGAILAQQGTLFSSINADLGNAVPNVPTPQGIPSVSAVLGPGENFVMRSTAIPRAAQAGSEAAAAVDPNETGILNTFAQSAAGLTTQMAQEVGGGVSSQGIANPLGPQVTYVDAGSGATSSSSGGGGSGGLIFIALAIVGGAAFLWYRSQHGGG
jgi:hypothetical protein